MFWQRKYRAAFLTSLPALFITVYVSLYFFHDYPFSHDEYAYLYQAQIFAQGKFYLSVAEKMRGFIEPCMVLIHGHLFSKYPPGFSALLALGVLAHAPGLVNPLLSTVTVGIIFVIVHEACGAVSALCAAALLTSSALFLGYGGSYFVHPLSLLLTASGFLYLIRYERSQGMHDAILASIAPGVLFIIRPLDGFCLGLVAMIAIAIRTPKAQRLKTLAYASIPMIAGACILYLFNFMMTGIWAIAVYPIWNGEFRIEDSYASDPIIGFSHVMQWYADSFMAYAVPTFLHNYLPLLGLGLGVAAIAGACVAGSNIVIPCTVFCCLNVGLYTFHPTMGNPLYGARYWYPTLAPIAILAGHAFHYLWQRRGTKVVLSLVLLVTATQMLSDYNVIEEYQPRFAALADLRENVERECPARSIVVLNPLMARAGGWPKYVTSSLLMRNPFLQNNHFFVLMNNAEAASHALPDYAICHYFYSDDDRATTQ